MIIINMTLSNDPKTFNFINLPISRTKWKKQLTTSIRQMCKDAPSTAPIGVPFPALLSSPTSLATSLINSLTSKPTDQSAEQSD